MLKNVWSGIRFAATSILMWIVILVALSAAMASTTSGGGPSGWWAVAMLLSPVAAVWVTHMLTKRRRSRDEERKASRERSRWEMRQLIVSSVERHLPALTKNYRTAVRRNDYGVILSDNRIAVILEFLYSIGYSPTHLGEQEAVGLVISELEAKPASSATFDPTRVPINGHEFEDWVADNLTRFGWSCSKTPGGGDQGIDVIAVKDGLRMGIQCKLYSQAVGNKAVQEALSGVQYYGLDRAVVLSNAPFTASAKALAEAANVLLVSHHEIPHLAQMALQEQPTGE